MAFSWQPPPEWTTCIRDRNSNAIKSAKFIINIILQDNQMKRSTSCTYKLKARDHSHVSPFFLSLFSNYKENSDFDQSHFGWLLHRPLHLTLLAWLYIKKWTYIRAYGRMWGGKQNCVGFFDELWGLCGASQILQFRIRASYHKPCYIF